MTKDYTKEFKDELERQLVHTTIKRDYLANRIETEYYDEPAQKRAKAKLDLDALEQKIDELEKFKKWLTQK